MASPFSGPVLGTGALLASPALYAALVEGTLPIDTAVVRLLVAIVVTWAGVSVLGSLLSGTSPQAAEPTADVELVRPTAIESPGEPGR